MATLTEKFEKIKSPKLQNQHHTAVILSAVEDTLRDQHADFSATAYFSALLALLPRVLSSSSVINKDIATSVVYLLDITIEHVPAPLLRPKFSQILTGLAPALTLPDVEAPLLRPSIGCLEWLLLAQDTSAWALSQTQIGPRRAIAGLLSLAVDHRPKVRKRAQDALVKVLKTPPPSPSLDHPAGDLCAETALQTLGESIASAGKLKKNRHTPSQPHHDKHHEPAVIHALQLVKTIAAASGGWPSKKIEPLCEMLMNVSRSSNEYITMGAFEVFEVIFEGMADDFSSSKLPRLLEAIQELRPAQNDSQLLPPWIAVLSRGYDVFAQIEPQETFGRLPELFDLISSFLASPSRNIRISASECLVSFLANCVPDSAILEPSVYDEKTLEKLAKQISNLLSVKYQAAWVEVFTVCAASFDAYKWRSSPFLNSIVKTIGELRGNDVFTGKKEADQVLGRAVYNMGPADLLAILPLNIIEQNPSQRGRVWLLPILRDSVSNTHLAHFRTEIVPLSENIYGRKLKAEKDVEIKIFETLINQLWSTLPGYCELPLDLTSSFDQSFAEMLATVLYKETDLRVNICHALQNLVESNQAILSAEIESKVGSEDLILQRRITKAAAQKNIDYLSTFSANLLAALFNVYSQTLPHYRGYILQCINSYLSITLEKELEESFTRVTTMLQAELPSEDAAAKQGSLPKGTGDKMPPTSHTLIDLLIAMSIYLPRTSFGTLFSLAAVVLNQHSSDPQLIKKAYKLIPRLAMTETGRQALEERNAELQSLIMSTSDNTPSPARRDRLLAIHELITYLPTSDLHFIPSVLPEVVLGCKESNEKARTAAFELLIHMGKRLTDPERNPPNTKIRNFLVPHLPDNSPDAPASLEEYFTMASAGLAGNSPHMVAASVTALSRLFFEFHDQLSSSSSSSGEGIRSDLVATVELFLTSNNREIVRSVLGFVKVAVVCLPEEMLRPQLSTLVPNLMVWSKERNGRLRMKVKGIIDRLVRRFGAPALEQLVGEADRKLVVNIRKERERKKRKKKDGQGDADDGHERDTTDNNENKSFNLSSDDDNGDSEDEADTDLDDASEIDVDEKGHLHAISSNKRTNNDNNNNNNNNKRGSSQGQKQYIREVSPASNPLDLLAPDALASISTTKPSVRFLNVKKNKRPSSAKFDHDGKLIIDDRGENTNTSHHSNRHAMDAGMTGSGLGASADPDQTGGIDAYLAAVSGPDAVRRGQKGRLKVSNAFKSGRHGNNNGGNGDGDEMDIDMDEGNGRNSDGRNVNASKNKKQSSLNGRRGLGVPKSPHTAHAGKVHKRSSGNSRGTGRRR